MKEFFVVWTMFDHGREASDTLYRAVLLGENKDDVRKEAELLVPKVIELASRESDVPIYDKDVEITVRPLDAWIVKLRQSAGQLRAVELDEE